VSALRQSLNDYLTMRRELGYKLERAGQLLSQFVDFCDQSGTEVVTVEVALTWATLPDGCSPGWGAFRLCVVRGFARYLHSLDPRTGVPPTDLLSTNYGRARPFSTQRTRSERCWGRQSRSPRRCGQPAPGQSSACWPRPA
jgi:integrase/recombinase XerD